MITYLDRVAIALAAGNIVQVLGLRSVADLKWDFTAFALAYALFEVPTDWMGDVFGPRRALLRIVLWWSAFTALTAAVGLHAGPVTLGLGFLIGVRLLFGLGEAGAFPNITRALHHWLPLEERGRGQGLVWFSGKLMGGLTPFLWTLVVVGTSLTPALLGWRGALCVFGFIGLAWCLLFARWFRDRPEENPEVNAAELELIHRHRAPDHDTPRSVPWRRIVTNGNFLTLCLMYSAQAYGWYFNIIYLPQFLERQYGLPNSSPLGALYKGGPLLMGALGCLLGFIVTDTIIRRTGDRRRARRLCGWIGHSLCVACFLICPIAPSAFVFFIAVSLAAFFTDLTVPSAWATCQDIGGRYTATVGAFMNTGAGLAGALAGWITGSVLESSIASRAAELGLAVKELTTDQTTAALRHGYDLNFYSFAALYVVAFLCWFRIDPTQRIEPATTGPAGPILMNQRWRRRRKMRLLLLARRGAFPMQPAQPFDNGVDNARRGRSRTDTTGPALGRDLGAEQFPVFLVVQSVPRPRLGRERMLKEIVSHLPDRLRQSAIRHCEHPSEFRRTQSDDRLHVFETFIPVGNCLVQSKQLPHGAGGSAEASYDIDRFAKREGQHDFFRNARESTPAFTILAPEDDQRIDVLDQTHPHPEEADRPCQMPVSLIGLRLVFGPCAEPLSILQVQVPDLLAGECLEIEKTNRVPVFFLRSPDLVTKITWEAKIIADTFVTAIKEIFRRAFRSLHDLLKGTLGKKVAAVGKLRTVTKKCASHLGKQIACLCLDKTR